MLIWVLLKISFWDANIPLACLQSEIARFFFLLYICVVNRTDNWRWGGGIDCFVSLKKEYKRVSHSLPPGIKPLLLVCNVQLLAKGAMDWKECGTFRIPTWPPNTLLLQNIKALLWTHRLRSSCLQVVCPWKQPHSEDTSGPLKSKSGQTWLAMGRDTTRTYPTVGSMGEDNNMSV